jgi:dCTP deaminase
MILCREDILEAREDGRIIIDPFEPELVGINSVDIRLGGDVFKLTGTEPRDLYSNDSSRWERVEPIKAGALRHLYPHFGLEVLDDDDDCFIFRSGGFYLATTLEAVGTSVDPEGRDGRTAIVPEMKARSTVGRQGLTVALCAGLGDVGYASRWALEVRVVDYGDIVLAVGTPIAQVVFHTATATSACYDGETRYQHAGSVRFLPKPLRVFREEP